MSRLSYGLSRLDIRTKLALVLVFVSLVSMGLIALFAYQTSSELLRDVSTRQLDALAESKAMDLEKVHQGWRDKTRLIRNSVELQEELEAFVVNHDDAAHQRLISVLNRTALGVEGVERVTIVNTRGDEICAVGRAQVFGEIELPQGNRDIAFQGVHLTDEKGLLVTFTAPLIVDGDKIGGIEVVFDADDLNRVATNYTGLGETGEVLVVARTSPNKVLVLNQLRHAENLTSPGQIPQANLTSSMESVLRGESGIYIDNVKDYRGNSVWAATRYLAELDWGLVIKVDASEEGERAIYLRDTMFDIALALSAFAIIGGTLLGFYLARPIHNLALVVQRMREGETELRASVVGDDEIAYLGESVNELIDYLQENYPDAQFSAGKADDDSGDVEQDDTRNA